MRFYDRSRPSTHELAAYLEEELSADDARRVEAELVQSLDARRRLRQLSAIRDRLAADDPALERIDLIPALDRAITAPPASRCAKAPAWIWGIGAFGFACVALAASLSGPGTEEYRAKSAQYGTPAPTRAGVRVWRADMVRPPEPVTAAIARSDGLLFSVSNLGSTPFTHLMIFAVDASAAIRWFYPAYVQEGTDPQSISIATRQVHSLLPNVIRHPYASGPLAIYALFTHEPLRVHSIEAWLVAQRLSPHEPPLRAAKLQRLDLLVNP
ncbi:MAG TPA: hypothetical protein VJV78_24110 [Polyangiales bacterium]|nr:hypothetical protein [Polyangiales bacterium]